MGNFAPAISLLSITIFLIWWAVDQKRNLNKLESDYIKKYGYAYDERPQAVPSIDKDGIIKEYVDSLDVDRFNRISKIVESIPTPHDDLYWGFTYDPPQYDDDDWNSQLSLSYHKMKYLNWQRSWMMMDKTSSNHEKGGQ
jgi:hypothetical protein